ncbi:MAG: DUF2842 domain-containing protein [Hyphomicrobiaceae bacterium]
MGIRTRKFVGSMLLLTFVILYLLLAMVVTARLLPGAPLVVQIAGYAFAGLVWVLPAGALISWMSRQPRPPADAP